MVLSIGRQVHVNHEDCMAGFDTKKRLYIKRVVGGVIAYCHHCSTPGFYRELTTDGTVLREWLLNDAPDAPRVNRSSSKDFILGEAITVSHSKIVAWLHQYYINPYYINPKGRINTDGDYFLQTNGELYLPIHNKYMEKRGYQIRSFNPKKPKYLTTYNSYTSTEVSWFIKDKPNETLVITEDYTSAYRVWRDTDKQLSSIALLKTSISDNTITQLYFFKRIIVWLDPDSAGIKAGEKIKDRIKYCLPSDVEVINLTSKAVQEPKHLDPVKLRETLGL